MPRIGVAALVAMVLVGALRPAEASPQAEAKEILDASGVRGGLIVHVGCGDGTLTAALRAGDGYLVHGLDADAGNVQVARRHIQSLGLYGPVCVDRLVGGRLPYIENFVNLVVSENLGAVPMDEVMRVLAPHGVAYIKTDGVWKQTVKPRPGEIDEWTHYLHDPSNNAVAHDTVVDFPRRFQWIGSPRYSRQHDHMSSISAMVSANGRNFYIFDEAQRMSILLPTRWFLTARDAFNGTVLWHRTIETWHEHRWPLKSGPQSMTRRLVAVGDRVYVTMNIDAPVSVLDAATGQTLRTYEQTKATEEILVDNGVLLLVVAAPGQPLRSDPKKAYADLAEIRADVTNPLWTQAPRTVMAVEAETGKVLWKKESQVVPMSLTADTRRVVFHDGRKLQCLDRMDGKVLWSSAEMPIKDGLRSSSGATVVLHDGVVLYSGFVAEEKYKQPSTTMYAVSAETGKTLWKAEHPPCGHSGTPKDILVVGGLVWCGAVAQGSDSGLMTGYDLHTGEVRKQYPPTVKTHWFHHRCYRAKATDRYLLFSRTGIEFIDTLTGVLTPHHWTRGGCLYGVMPCNGLIYNPPHPCACYIEAKLYGFQALAPASKTWSLPAAVPDAGRLERGPAYDQAGATPTAAVSGGADWPTYRGNNTRSGWTKSAVAPENLRLAWEVNLGGRLSAAVVADGRLLVASVDTHTVHALDAATGKALWSFTAGGRVDSPPTVWQGRALFGCADGYVYCLRAADGELAWKFRAAPEDRRLEAFEQVESVWPVPGSVLVQDDPAAGQAVAYCVAGRSMFVDGGLRLLRLDPRTGAKLSETVMDDRQPASGENLQVEVKGLNMPVALPDLLSSDGRNVYMHSLPFDLQGNRRYVTYVDVKDQQGDDRHLFSPTGFLDDSLWHRTYWTYGRAFASGASGFYQAGRVTPAGKILVHDETTVYGFGRQPKYYKWTTPMEFRLFATPKDPEIVRISGARTEPPKPAKGKDGKKKGTSRADSPTRFVSDWEESVPFLVRAIVLAGRTLYAAGPADVLNEEDYANRLADPQMRAKAAEQSDLIEGKGGSMLWAVSAGDGKKLASYDLASMPIFDGLAVANGCLYVVTIDGKVQCMGGGEGRPLKPAPSADPTPLDTGAGQAARDPNSAAKDFARVSQADVLRCEMGYRVQVSGKGTGFAIKKLDAPLKGKVSFRVKMQPAPVGEETGRSMKNGFLVFGDSADGEKMVKCGVRYAQHKAMICEEAVTSPKAEERIEADDAKPMELAVTVDLDSGQVTLTAGGKTVTAKLDKPLSAVTHVGYAVMNTATDFGPVEVK